MEEDDRGPVEPALREPERPDAFRRNPDSGKGVVGIAASGNLGVYERACRRQFLSGNVMVGDKDVQTVVLGVVYLGYAGDAAVDRDGKRDAVIDGLFNAVHRHSVRIIAHRDIVSHIQTHAPEL